MKVMVNRVRCKKCDDVISSSYRHDFRRCACKAIFIDGGTDYQRFGWGATDPNAGKSDAKDYIDFSLSIYQATGGKQGKQDSLDDVLDLVKDIAQQVEARKRDDDTYETLYYERELKGHLTEILKLKHKLAEKK